MSAQPPVPQRPARSQDQAAANDSNPKVPPRPTRHFERKISHDRDNASRSPLNDSPFALPGKGDSSLSSGQLTPPAGLPRRNPSVPSLPLIGQEGNEYASLDESAAAPSTGAAPAQVSNVADDLPLHAPRASDSTTQSKISVVTGGSKSKDAESSPVSHSATGKSRPPSTVYERAASREGHHHSEDEHGIPSFGVTVPMYRNAGDVQAPAAGTSSHGNSRPGSRPPTSDGRRRSMQGFYGPPGSYGLHGHGHLAYDQFEKEWYARHPEEVAKEQHALHVPAALQDRPAYAMSSDELNQLVRDTSRPGSGMGAYVDGMSIPSEAQGYQVSEETFSRAVPAAAGAEKKRLSRPPSLGHVDSPLRKTFSAQDDDGVPPEKVPSGDRKGEFGATLPILASDEVAKHPGSGWMQPAVSPSQMLSEDDYFSAQESDHSSSRTKVRKHSKGHDLSRLISHEHDGMHTPLEDIEEYEPLFDEESEKKPITLADKVKRPDLERRRFPSQDIWEDTPTSLQLETTVETPEEAEARQAEATKASAVFETPETEALRKAEIVESERGAAAQTATQAKPKFAAHLKQERPGNKRFPSQDIWEDTPDSLRLETTVGEDGLSPPDVPARPVRSKEAQPVVPPRPQKTAERKAPPVSEKPKPQVPQRPGRSPARDIIASSPEDEMTTAKAKPTVPARPTGNPKFSSIRAGFLNDLNSRIGLGPAPPTKPKEEQKEEEEDKAPLGDARRGRARGPARRKPATSPGVAAVAAAPGWGISQPVTVWSISGNDGAVVAPSHVSSVTQSRPTAVRELSDVPIASPLARNTAGESLVDTAIANELESVDHPLATEMDARAHRESAARKEALRTFEEERIGHAGDIPDPIPEPYVEGDAGRVGAKTEVPLTASVQTMSRPTTTDMPGKAELDSLSPTSPVAKTQISPMETVMDDDE